VKSSVGGEVNRVRLPLKKCIPDLRHSQERFSEDIITEIDGYRVKYISEYPRESQKQDAGRGLFKSKCSKVAGDVLLKRWFAMADVVTLENTVNPRTVDFE